MASRQQQQIEAQQRLLVAREQRLKFLKQGGGMVAGVPDHDRLRRMRDRVDAQEAKLRRLRALRGQVESTRLCTASLTSDLDAMRQLFSEKEKEMAVAVARVDQLTRQLEALRSNRLSGGGQRGGHHHAELDKLRRELLYRNSVNRESSGRVVAQRELLAAKTHELTRLDTRIAELQTRLHRKKLLNHQLAHQITKATQAKQAQLRAVKERRKEGPPEPPGVKGPPDAGGELGEFTGVKQDPKYQTLPYNTKLCHPGTDGCATTCEATTTHQEPPPGDHNNQDTDNHTGTGVSGIPHTVHSTPANKPAKGHALAPSASTYAGNNVATSTYAGNNVATSTYAGNNVATSTYAGNNVPVSTYNGNNISALTYNGNNVPTSIYTGNNVPASIYTGNNVPASIYTGNNVPSSVPTSTNVPTSTFSNSNQENVPSSMPAFTSTPNYTSNSTSTYEQSTSVSATSTSSSRTLSLSQQHQQKQLQHQQLQHQQQKQEETSQLFKPALPPKPTTTTTTTPTTTTTSPPPPLITTTTTTTTTPALVAPLPATPPRLMGEHQMLEKGKSGTPRPQKQGSRLPVMHSRPLSSTSLIASTISSLQNRASESASASSGSVSASSGNVSASSGTVSASSGTASASSGTDSSGNVSASGGVAHALSGSTSASSSSASSSSGSASASSGSTFTSSGSASASSGSASASSGSTSASSGSASASSGNVTNIRATGNASVEVVVTPAGDGGEEVSAISAGALANISANSGANDANSAASSATSGADIVSSGSSGDNSGSNSANSGANGSISGSNSANSGSSGANSVSNGTNSVANSDNPPGHGDETGGRKGVHVSINRRIEMPPDFLFPETEMPNDLLGRALLEHDPAAEDTTDRAALPSDVISDVSQSDTTTTTSHLVVRRKGNLKTHGTLRLPRRVSFDPLALLLDASLEGELELVKRTAMEVPNPSAANDEGITALHNAICAGHLDIVSFLVTFGCDVNAQDSDGWTPLHCAASCNNLAMVRFLVEHGACILATTLSDHETPAEKCEQDEEGYDGCSQYLYSIQEKLGILNGGLVYAVYDYAALNADELSFKCGDAMTVLRRGDECEREWWWGQLHTPTAPPGGGSDPHPLHGYLPRNLLGLYPRVKNPVFSAEHTSAPGDVLMDTDNSAAVAAS